MAGLVENVTNINIDRKAFLDSSAAASDRLARSGRGNTLSPRSPGGSVEIGAEEKKGKWVTVACWHNCGGRCVNKALVVDGVVVRQKTDDSHPDSEQHPQQRACSRGRAQRQQVFGADRLKYPMKRKHWAPGGGDKSLRGRDEWERISWEEAYKYISDETKRIYAEHGPRSVFLSSYFGDITQIFSRMGGYVGADTGDSYGCWTLFPVEMGTSFLGSNPNIELANDRLDMKNAETIVLYSCNPAWASGGNPASYFWQAKEAGARFVVVGPEYNSSANLLEAKWIRVRPGTDTAFLLAVAHTMLAEDDPVRNPIIDWDFLHRCTVGFDENHMPADSELPAENFKGYLLGLYDGIPKTPQWATEICGTPVEDILWYAREMRRDKKVMILHSYASARCNGAEDLPQLYMTIGAMGGHMGKSGHACATAYHFEAGNSGTDLVKYGSPRIGVSVPNPIHEMIQNPLIWKSIVDGKYTYIGNRVNPAGVSQFQPPQEREIDIKLIYSVANNWFQTRMDVMNARKAYRKVDLAVSHAYVLNPTAQYSDIVLPCCTRWETHMPFTTTFINRELVIFPSPVTSPLFEAKQDQQIIREMAAYFGYDPAELFPYSEKQQFFDVVAGSQVIDEDGKTWTPLATVTEADIEAWGVDNKPQQGRVPFQELVEKGFYHVERHEGDNYGYIGYQEFREDPVANPRPYSASGKLEICCQKKADNLNMINALGFSTDIYKPYPTYHVPNNGYEQSYEDWNRKVKGEYPFQLFQPHYPRRAHTALDNLPWLREAFANPVFLNRSDAESRGITDGDTVLICNQWGKVLRHASLTDTLMPGCVALPHGPWPEFDEETEIDLGGNENVLLGPVTSGYPVAGYNTCLVNVEKYGGPPILPDRLKPQKSVNVG